MMFDWAMDEPTVTAIDYAPVDGAVRAQEMFTASATSPIDGTTIVSYRWDFGDGSPYLGPGASNVVGHDYAQCGNFTVRVEVVDSLGNHAIGTLDIVVENDCEVVAVGLATSGATGDDSAIASPLMMVTIAMLFAVLTGGYMAVNRRRD